MPAFIIPGPQVSPVDWLEYARYFILSKVPQLCAPDRSTDLDDSGLDWTAEANVGFPGTDSGGTLQLSTVFIAGSLGWAQPKVPVNNVEYIYSSLTDVWGIAGRTRTETGTANTRAAFVACMRLNANNSVNFGLLGDGNTSFLSAWFTSGASVTTTVPVVTTIPFLGKGVYHEVYATYNGNTIDLWGGGDFRKGIEPFHGGELNEHSLLADSGAAAGLTIQSVDAVTTESMSTGSLLGKVTLVP